MVEPTREHNGLRPWQRELHTFIFEADTPSGKFFDIALIVCILLSVLVVMLDSVASINQQYGELLYSLEWFFTILFTVEYLLRLSCVVRPSAYAGSFFGVVDLLAVLPTYLSVLLPGTRYLLVIRLLRVLRVFRVLKIVRFVSEASQLRKALFASSRKIFVFLFAVMTIVVILGSLMYVIEGEEHGFTSIPKSVYWAIVTLTTVGYGDLSPQTGLGQSLAAVIMILGYSIIAVPTGIVSVEMAQVQGLGQLTTQSCPHCTREGHAPDAKFCKHCGSAL
jgi:voltage-gated potassium channel